MEKTNEKLFITLPLAGIKLRTSGDRCKSNTILPCPRQPWLNVGISASS